MRRGIGSLVVLALIGGAVWIGLTSRDETPIVTKSGSVVIEEPRSAEDVRAAILEAAEDGDYGALRPFLDPGVFLSDYGYGIDPIDRWAELGEEPLVLMSALLQMEHVRERSNEGLLLRWPVYDAKTETLEEISDRDRSLFLSAMSPEKFQRLVPNDEYGYVGPRLGILEDGTWWFFIMEPGP